MKTDVTRFVRTVNLFPAYHDLIADFADRAAAFAEVAGVIILGGLASGGNREFADEYSDLDICIVLSLPEVPPEALCLPFPEFSSAVQEFLPPWLPNFKFRVPPRESPHRIGIDMDVHQLILQYERQPSVTWDSAKLEAYSATAEIWFDRSGEVRKLIDQKLEGCRCLLRNHLVATLASVPVRIGIDVERCIRRGLMSHAHEVLNLAFDHLLTALFALNGEHPPNRKWRILTVGSLPWRPRHTPERFEEALLVKSFREEDVRRRGELLLELTREMTDYCLRSLPWFPKDAYSHACTRIFGDRQLRTVTAADSSVPSGLLHHQKIELPEWNQANWRLVALDAAARET